MTILKSKNSSWKINDGFDHLRSTNFLVWIKEFNHASSKIENAKTFIDNNTIAKAMSFWYISIKILKYWNSLDENNNHWNSSLKVLVYYEDTYTIRELWQALNQSEGHEVYKIETVRRYVGEMCAAGLLRRAGNVATGRLQPSSYLAYAVGETQKQWMKTYQELTTAMSKALTNSTETWGPYEMLGTQSKTESYLSDDRAKAQFI